MKTTLGTLGAVLWLFGGTCSALTCYNCGWSASRCQTRGERAELDDEPPPYPIADTCIGNSSYQPDRDTIERSCRKERCYGKDQACMSWTFLTGNPENITLMCVGNPGSRSGCYKMEIPRGDNEKKYNTKSQQVEVCLCHDRDLCNGVGRIAGAPSTCMLLLLMATVVWIVGGINFSIYL